MLLIVYNAFYFAFYVYNVVPFQKLELWECLQHDHALKQVCKQSNGEARRHGRGDVEEA